MSQEFSHLYIINAEEVLGSGQFGIVYGGLKDFFSVFVAMFMAS